jgi:hypothetical protein
LPLSKKKKRERKNLRDMPCPFKKNELVLYIVSLTWYNLKASVILLGAMFLCCWPGCREFPPLDY